MTVLTTPHLRLQETSTVDLSVLTVPLLYIIKNCSLIYATLGVNFGTTVDR